MTKPAQVAALANFAKAELGSIDLWLVFDLQHALALLQKLSILQGVHDLNCCVLPWPVCQMLLPACLANCFLHACAFSTLSRRL